MGIKGLFDIYLQHFGSTCTVRDLHINKSQEDMIALRHDVDYSIDIALEMAWREHDFNCRATYFILHDAPYVHEEYFLDKCLQIQELGHEIGIHNNLITEWVKNGTAIANVLQEFLASFRDAGINIQGLSTHGDVLCYEHKYINAWLFSESLFSDQHTGALNAEAIPAFLPNEEIVPPSNNTLQINGRSLELGNFSLRDFDLEYQAHNVLYDKYYTDTGKNWHRSVDPLTENVSEGRNLILMHPIWWAEKQRIFFILSTARSGSKWLATQIESASSSRANHEFMLNHSFFNNELHEEKVTGSGFRDYSADRDMVSSSLQNIKEWVKSIPGDYTEVNVYLAHVMDILKMVFPEAVIVHLHRNAKDVVRSLINRSWYDTPDDDRHPAFNVPNWHTISQLERCCWYYRITNEEITRHSDFSVSLEKITSDYKNFNQFISKVGLRVVLPNVARKIHKHRLNENQINDFPPFEQWSTEDQASFAQICGTIQTELRDSIQSAEFATEAKDSFRQKAKKKKIAQTVIYQSEIGWKISDIRKKRYSTQEIDLRKSSNHLTMEVASRRSRHSYVIFGNGTWNNMNPSELFKYKNNKYYRLEISIDVPSDMNMALHILMYDKDGQLLRTPHSILAQQMRRNYRGVNTVSFAAAPNAIGFTYGLFVNKESEGGLVTIRDIRLIEIAAV